MKSLMMVLAIVAVAACGQWVGYDDTLQVALPGVNPDAYGVRFDAAQYDFTQIDGIKALMGGDGEITFEIWDGNSLAPGDMLWSSDPISVDSSEAWYSCDVSGLDSLTGAYYYWAIVVVPGPQVAVYRDGAGTGHSYTKTESTWTQQSGYDLHIQLHGEGNLSDLSPSTWGEIKAMF